MKRKWLTALTVALLVMSNLGVGRVTAGDWFTKGGDQHRSSTVTDAVGVTTVEEAWIAPLELGQSATQPVVVGNTIYHLAGSYLWRIDLTETGDVASFRPLGNGSGLVPEPVNRPSPNLTLVSQSSPSYSFAKGTLYFGTAYGRFWAYRTDRQVFNRLDLELGCPIVGSPLVLQAYGKEFVVVADRPNFPGEIASPLPGQPLCPRQHGTIWLVYEKDGQLTKLAYDGPNSKVEGGFGGFITPSAIPALWKEGPGFVVGTDGFGGGRAIGLIIRRLTGQTFELKHKWQLDGTAGFAGTFSSDGSNAYWLDTAGHLWGAALGDGGHLDGWPAQSVSIPKLIGVSDAFTNTEPAVVRRKDGTHLYLTLRNWSGGNSPPLRGGPTGSDGAVVAIGPKGQLEWYRQFGPADRDSAGRNASINTAPLAIPAANALLFGDVNGHIYSYALDTANRSGGHLQPFLVPGGQSQATDRLFLLKPGEQPARGGFNFSQISGVGVDPAMGAGLLLMGVNYTNAAGSGGRLVAYRVAPAYNLRWADAPPAQALSLTPGKAHRYTNQVAMELIDQPISDICGRLPQVAWYVTGPGGYSRHLGHTPLPGALSPAAAQPVGLDLLLTAADPAQGHILGIIDHPTVLALAGAKPADAAVAQTQGLNGSPAPSITCRENGGRASEIVAVPGRDGALNGLADNLLAIPYRRGAIQDDVAVASLIGPGQTVINDAFSVVPSVAYWNNQGKESVTFTMYATARLGDVLLEAKPQVLTIPVGCCTTLEPIRATEMQPGAWEVTVTLAYPPDTNLKNNTKTIIVTVAERWNPGKAPTYGSGLSN